MYPRHFFAVGCRSPPPSVWIFDRNTEQKHPNGGIQHDNDQPAGTFYPWYTEDTFIEVSDEVAAFLEEDRRLQVNYAQYIRDNKAFYSLDAGDGIEAETLNLPEQPDEALERMELERLLKEALAQLTPRSGGGCPYSFR